MHLGGSLVSGSTVYTVQRERERVVHESLGGNTSHVHIKHLNDTYRTLAYDVSTLTKLSKKL